MCRIACCDDQQFALDKLETFICQFCSNHTERIQYDLYLSAHIEYSPKATELRVFRYIMKDSFEENFTASLEAAITRVHQHDEKSYLIMDSRRLVKIYCRDIDYCRKDGKMSIIVTKDAEIKERKTLVELLDDLNKVSGYFVMAERGYIVNMNEIARVEGKNIVLKSGIQVPLGSSFASDVKNKVKEYWKGKVCGSDGELNFS